MKPLSRRSVTTGLAAAVTAIPALGFATGAKADPASDALLEAIHRYRAEINAANSSHGLSDEDLDDWIDRADAILEEAVSLPVLTTASAMAVIDLFVDDGWILAQHNLYGDELVVLVKTARNYIASTVT
jgi:hypothetical protein